MPNRVRHDRLYNMKNISVKIEHEKERLDKFLTGRLPGLSRSQIQKMIKRGEVLVNGEKSSVHCFLKEGDRVGLDSGSEAGMTKKEAGMTKKEAGMTKKEVGMTKKEVGMTDIILHKEKDFLIINKPAGLMVHPTERGEKGTLAELLVKKFPALKKVGDDPLRPGIVHRLDKDVSGLMVVARTPEMFELLKKQFKARKVKKEYIALVLGNVPKVEGVIDLPIARSASGEKMAARARGGELKEKERTAITEYVLVKDHKNYSLLKINIKTGRTHQIRVHMNAFGHPIAGETVYVPKKFRRPRKWEGFDRIFLHSAFLGFTDRAGEWREFKSDLPKELEEFMERL